MMGPIPVEAGLLARPALTIAEGPPRWVAIGGIGLGAADAAAPKRLVPYLESVV